MKTKFTAFLSVVTLLCLFVPVSVLAGTISYTYDNTGRLTGADYGGGKTISYTYDNNGNLLSNVTTTTQVSPTPDIKANGQDTLVSVSQGSPVSVTVGLDPGEYAGLNADWWIAVHTPFDPPGDWYTYVYPSGWSTGIRRCVQAPLLAFSGFEVFNMVLPLGTYTFYFVLDAPDGMVTADFLDSVEVRVE